MGEAHYDIALGPSPSITFEDNAMICDGPSALLMLANRSSLPGKVDYSIIGERSRIMDPGQSIPLGETGLVFFLNIANPADGTLIGGIR